jgi:protein-arginine kinase activator protein McsA
MSIFKKKPLCEECGDNEATAFVFIPSIEGDHHQGSWKFCCTCTSEDERYDINIEHFFRSPACTVDWLAHTNGKRWVNWPDFMDMMSRFRHATDSYGSI